MTCIVGVVDNGRVVIGGDSAGSDGWHIEIRADSKVFTVGPYAMGFTTSFRMGQLLRYQLKVGAPDTWDVDRFMSTTFVDAVRTCLKDGGWAKDDSGREVGGKFLVGVGGRLYTIDSDYQIGVSSCGYAAVGSGYLAALGALYATPDRPAAERVDVALLAAAHLTDSVRAPFMTVETGAVA